MGASSSTEQVPVEQRELEREAASMGVLPMLEKAFSTLSSPLSNSIPLASLHQCFRLKYGEISCQGTDSHKYLTSLLDHFGPAVIDLHFTSQNGGGISWIEFLRGYMRCCGRIPASSSLNALFKVSALSAEKAGSSQKLQFDSGEDGGSKVRGSITPVELGMILWLCWMMSWSARRSSNCATTKNVVYLPDVNSLVASAIVCCAENGSSDFDAWRSEVLTFQVELDAAKIHSWTLTTVPNLAGCFSHFIHSTIEKSARFEGNETGTLSSSDEDMSSPFPYERHLLTSGRAWGISLSQRGDLSEEILKTCFPCKLDLVEESLLYRSSLHGKGLNRFWSSTEGYLGPLLMLISAYSTEGSETDPSGRKWIIGALTEQGFENRDVFYGTGGHLFAIWPVFHIFSPSGKQKNFLYSRLRPVGKVYESHQKPAGIGFGGTIKDHRIFIDEEFERATIRHHAGDKSYQPGPLVPNQGFLPVEASVIDVEVWGLGGKKAKEMQMSYKKREHLFTEQRRKVDLKTFSSWEDSPEKMMMDLVSDPTGVQREKR
ncbi:hypothetical protein AKJ16_DCAP25566 [Drosera capensis]